ncbi:alanyl-tRNA editing protein [Stomatobaculum longum]|uniref:alanyl-tRNA editing protein n=1 Tax=Stomatobaculum longum TaxID=796942 RepID=UPI0028EB3307|nr:alanyl-tRNA editing protein [Stomatobaculum longum]
MTEAIFDRDSRELSFKARVLSCEERRTAAGESRFAVVLDRTAFFPEQGGQKADRGTLGGASLLDAEIHEGVITHILDAPLEAGSEVEGEVDWPRRFDFMQQHTGEHILSGLANRLYGAENVGFHLSEREVQLDFSVQLSEAELEALEHAANQAIFRDIPVKAYYPNAEELAALNYRQKKELTGAIRIVELEGVDCCACCAPHVARSSEVGILKILSTMNYKGGTRLYIACGMRAVQDYAARIREAQQLSKLLSAPQGELSAAVVRVQEKAMAAEQRAAETALALILLRAEAEIREKAQTQGREQAEADGICLILPPLPESALQRAVKPLKELFSGVVALFAGDDENGYAFLMFGDGVDWKPFLAELRTRGGKGGGGKDRVQGRLLCRAKDLHTIFHDFVIKQN